MALLALVMATPLFAQQGGIVEGRITQATTDRPLTRVQVGIYGTTLGTLTNEIGSFRLAYVPVGERTVRIRLIGHAPAERKVNVVAGQTFRLDVVMTQATTTLNEVVVTGTGERVETRKLGNTVAIVKPPEVAPTTSVSEILQGREPGVVGLPSGGITGTGSRIRIRPATAAGAQISSAVNRRGCVRNEAAPALAPCPAPRPVVWPPAGFGPWSIRISLRGVRAVARARHYRTTHTSAPLRHVRAPRNDDRRLYTCSRRVACVRIAV